MRRREGPKMQAARSMAREHVEHGRISETDIRAPAEDELRPPSAARRARDPDFEFLPGPPPARRGLPPLTDEDVFPRNPNPTGGTNVRLALSAAGSGHGTLRLNLLPANARSGGRGRIRGLVSGLRERGRGTRERLWGRGGKKPGTAEETPPEQDDGGNPEQPRSGSRMRQAWDRTRESGGNFARRIGEGMDARRQAEIERQKRIAAAEAARTARLREVAEAREKAARARDVRRQVAFEARETTFFGRLQRKLEYRISTEAERSEMDARLARMEKRMNEEAEERRKVARRAEKDARKAERRQRRREGRGQGGENQ